MHELEECPFCDGNPRVVHTWTASYWIECDCGIQYHLPDEIGEDDEGGEDGEGGGIRNYSVTSVVEWNDGINGRPGDDFLEIAARLRARWGIEESTTDTDTDTETEIE